MENSNPEIDRIRELMQTRPEGCSITDISKSLGINRNTITKYLDILRMQGHVDAKKKGTSKVYSLTRRLPVYPLKRCCTLPLLIIDADLVVNHVNMGFLELAGLSRDTCAGKRIDTLGIEVTESADSRSFFRTAISRAEQRCDLLISAGRKGPVPCTATFLPIVFENGRPGLAIIAESPDRLKTANPVAVPGEARDPYRTILEDGMEYYVRFMPDGTILDVNEAYCRDTGRTRRAILGTKFRPVIPLEDQKRVGSLLAGLTVGKPSSVTEHRAIMGNGETRWQRWKDCAVFDESGTVTEYHSFGIDITDLIHVRQQLKKLQDSIEEVISARTAELRETNRQIYDEIAHRERAEQQLLLTQFALDNAGDMVLWVDRSGGIQYANNRAALESGYQLKDLKQCSFATLIPEYDLSRWDDLWNRLHEEQVIHFESPLILRDNQQVPAEIAVNYVAFKNAEYACCFIRDITERKRGEEAVRQANRKLNVLASLTRHDIMNKVTIVLAYIGRAKKIAHNPVLLDYLNRQEKAVKAMRSRIAFTRDYKDLGIHPPAWFNIQELAEKSWIEHSAEGVSFSSDLNGIEVFADPFFEKIPDMILEYTLHYGGLVTSISCSSRLTPQALIISISDNGSGIPVERKNGIFSGDSNDNDGMGLFLASEILGITGIGIHETGIPGKGSMFEITVKKGNYRISKGRT